MATSGRQLQLAIAPAGTGKTTAMRALATAWTSSGGNVLGLAPSAAAAEELRTHLDTDGTTRVVADNLAKLVWAIGHEEPLADVVGLGDVGDHRRGRHGRHPHPRPRRDLVLDRGASVRLIGDDQQLGAIGAGGVLRDIAATHGALRLDT
jgi:ATP-dependent exoDNAse (exonuclease V) alpha subunit